MYNYKIGDKFKWRKNDFKNCFIKEFLNDVYELAQRENGDYYVKTIYSETGDYRDWLDNNLDYIHSYEDICEEISKNLEKIKG